MPAQLNSDRLAIGSEAFREDVFRMGAAVYERLKGELESHSTGRFIAIHVDSGDYEVARTSSLATRALLTRHGRDGRLFGRRIGDQPEFGLASRLFGSTSGIAK